MSRGEGWEYVSVHPALNHPERQRQTHRDRGRWGDVEWGGTEGRGGRARGGGGRNVQVWGRKTTRSDRHAVSRPVRHVICQAGQSSTTQFPLMASRRDRCGPRAVSLLTTLLSLHHSSLVAT